MATVESACDGCVFNYWDFIPQNSIRKKVLLLISFVLTVFCQYHRFFTLAAHLYKSQSTRKPCPERPGHVPVEVVDNH